MGKYALLIGVDTYGEGLQPLPAASRDVAALREVLLNPQMGGFDEAKPVVNPTQPEMAREIELWFQDRQPEDLVLLFFSGHGVKDDRRDLYFAAANTEKQRHGLIRSTATPARFLHDCIRGCKAKYQVLILDCCFSGAFGELVARDDGAIDLKEQLGAEGRVVLTSTSAVDYSFEEKGAELSIYTRYLVEGIASGAADADGDGVITVDELHRYAGRKVRETSPVMSPDIIHLKGEGYQIRLARSPQDDPRLKYRKEVERRATAGVFTIPAQRLLMGLRVELQIAEAEAEAIEAEVLKPYREYQRKRQDYEETFRQCLAQESPLGSRTLDDLKDYRAHLRLKPEDVAQIEWAVLDGYDLAGYVAELERQQQAQAQQQAEADRQRQEAEAQQRHEQDHKKRQRYGKEFERALAAGYPLDDFVRQGLQQFQASLGLSDEVVAQIEQPLLAPKEVKYKQQQERRQQEQKQREQAVAEHKRREAEAQRQREAERQKQAEAERQKQAAAKQPQLDTDDLSSARFGANYYVKLRDLLAAKDWKAADKETADRMCEVMNRQKKGWLRVEDIQKFPCLDLGNIDRLWVTYSQGRFGFTVQKKIWESCGSPTEYNKDWEKFGVQVGWRSKMEGGDWLSYSQLNFDLNAPRGHLPFVVVVRFVWRLGAVAWIPFPLSSVASRLVDCSR